MEFKEYGSNLEMDKLVDSSKYEDRISAAKQGYGLDKLVWDENEFVRLAVAMQGRPQDLATLAVIEAVQKVCERDSSARENVVNLLDINDSKYGRLLDWFVNDENFSVRAAVARHGRDKDLDVLVHDKSDWVRYVVAEQGRPKDLVALLNDDDLNVCDKVRKVYEGDSSIRENMVNLLDINDSKHCELLDGFVNDDNFLVRAAVARHGRDKDLDVLVHDKSDWVRYVVAEQGRPKDLVVLVNDDDLNVKDAVRKYKEHHPDWNKSKDIEYTKETKNEKKQVERD